MILNKDGKQYRTISTDDVMLSNKSKAAWGELLKLSNEELELASANNYLGYGISDILSMQDKEIQELKSQVKWLYKYGGSGTGTGTGSSSGSTGTASMLVRIGEWTVSDKTVYLDNGEADYSIYIKIQKPGGDVYVCDVVYGGKNVKRIIFQDGTYDCTFQLHMTGTQQIQISCTDNTTDVALTTISTTVTTSGNIFTVSLTDSQATTVTYTSDSCEIMLRKCSPLTLNLNYQMVQTGCTVSYAITSDLPNFENIDNTGQLDYEQPSIPYTKSIQLMSYADFVSAGKSEGDLMGTYTLTVQFIVQVDGGSQSKTISKTISLVPNSLYVLVQSSAGTLYKSSSEANSAIESTTGAFKAGRPSITIKVYNGESWEGYQPLYIYLDETLQSLSITQFALRQTYNLGDAGLEFTASTESKVKKLSITTSPTWGRGTVCAELYCAVLGIDLSYESWGYYDWGRKSVGEADYNTYFRCNSEDTENVHIFSNQTFLNSVTTTYTTSIEPLSYDIICTNNRGVPSAITDEYYDMHLAIGIQYSNINDTNYTIFDAKSSTNTFGIKATQSTITIHTSTKDYDIPYYLPMADTLTNSQISENWHLLDIAIVLVSNTAGPKFEICVYIDGCLEGIAQNYTSTQPQLRTIDINPDAATKNQASYMIINLLDISYHAVCSHEDTSYNGSTFTTYDPIAQRYYYKYYITCINNDPTSSLGQSLWYSWLGADSALYGQASVNTITQNVQWDTETGIGLPYVSAATINEIAANNTGTRQFNAQYNIMVIHSSKPNATPNGSSYDDIGDYLYNLLYQYSETAESTFTPFTGTVDWISEGETQLRTITWDALQSEDVTFQFELQGSSSKQYKIKNFEMSIIKSAGSGLSDDDELYFSPNFKDEKYAIDPTDPEELKEIHNTFLPESSFTLKADFIDSSHSNNNAMGMFINEFQTKFPSAIDKESPYYNYTKNCLTGMPFLLFINFGGATPETNKDERARNYYYFGIYNFNLGRKSYNNMGYNKYDKAFDFSKYSKDGLFGDGSFRVLVGSDLAETLSIDSNFLMCEISDGSPRYDFSQYDESILFQQVKSQSTYMLSDIVTTDYKTTADGKQLDAPLSSDALAAFIKQIALAGGWCFEALKKQMIELRTNGYSCEIQGVQEDAEKTETTNSPYKIGFGEYANNVYTYTSLNYVTDYKTQQFSSDHGVTFNNRTTGTDRASQMSLQKCISAVTNSQTGQTTSAWINFKSLIEYYIICTGFGMVDSVMKNLELKTWNYNDYNADGSKNPTFYTAFYDMDTCIGIDNSGDETSYFSYTDYWNSHNTQIGETNIYTANNANVYMDYFPTWAKKDTSKITGFDVPSTYLFAIAKYALMQNSNGDYICGSISGRLTSDLGGLVDVPLTPNNLWAYFRTTTAGKTAKNWINTYFSARTKKIPNTLFNLNYRTKYGGIDSYTQSSAGSHENVTGTISNISRLKGRCVAKKEEWLIRRFRLMDAYMNLCNVKEDVAYYNSDNSGWEYYDSEQQKTVKNTVLYGNSNTALRINTISNALQTKISQLVNNNDSDCTILTSIYGALTLKESASGTLEITAPVFTPIVMEVGEQNIYRYLIGGNYKYRFNVTTSGNQAIMFFGSSAWETISDICFMTFDTLNLNSPTLKTITASSANSVGDIYLTTPAAETISLTAATYTGNLTLSKANQNIKSVTISNTKISINDLESNTPIERQGITTFNANNISSSSIDIQGWSQLTNVNLNGSKITTLKMPAWSTDISINENSGSGKTENLLIENLTIDANAKRFDESGERTFTYTGTNAQSTSTIKNITLLNFNRIIISNAPNLETVTISGPEVLDYISITDCATNTTKFILKDSQSDTEGLSDNGYIYLPTLKEKATVSFKNIANFEQFIVGNTVILASDAFNGCTRLKTLTVQNSNGCAIISGSKIFYNCSNFTLQTNNGGVCPLVIPTTVASLSYMFAIAADYETYDNPGNSSITIDAYNNWIKWYDDNWETQNDYWASLKDSKGNPTWDGPKLHGFDQITDISYMCQYQYSMSNHKQGYGFKVQPLVSVFTNVTKVTGAFFGCDIRWLTKDAYSFGKYAGNGTLALSSVYGSSGQMHISSDIFSYDFGDFPSGDNTHSRYFGDRASSYREYTVGGGIITYYVYGNITDNSFAGISELTLRNVISPLKNITDFRGFGRLAYNATTSYDTLTTVSSTQYIHVNYYQCFEDMKKTLKTIYSFLWCDTKIIAYNIEWVQEDGIHSIFSDLPSDLTCDYILYDSYNSQKALNLYYLFSVEQWKKGKILPVRNINNNYNGQYTWKKYISTSGNNQWFDYTKNDTSTQVDNTGNFEKLCTYIQINLRKNEYSNFDIIFQNCDVFNVNDINTSTHNSEDARVILYMGSSKITSVTQLNETFRSMRSVYEGVHGSYGSGSPFQKDYYAYTYTDVDTDAIYESPMATRLASSTPQNKIYIHPKFFDAFPNVTILYYTFAELKVASMVPFNFFRKKNNANASATGYIYGYNTIIDIDNHVDGSGVTYRFRRCSATTPYNSAIWSLATDQHDADLSKIDEKQPGSSYNEWVACEITDSGKVLYHILHYANCSISPDGTSTVEIIDNAKTFVDSLSGSTNKFVWTSASYNSADKITLNTNYKSKDTILTPTPTEKYVMECKRWTSDSVDIQTYQIVMEFQSSAIEYRSDSGYNPAITTMSGLFYNTLFDIPYYDPSLEEYFDSSWWLKKTEYTSEGDGDTYKLIELDIESMAAYAGNTKLCGDTARVSIYSRSTCAASTEVSIRQSYELYDIINKSKSDYSHEFYPAYSIAEKAYQYSNGTAGFTNYQITETREPTSYEKTILGYETVQVIDRMFIAPDFFTGCSDSCILNKCFQQADPTDVRVLHGYIPQYMLYTGTGASASAKSGGTVENFMCNLKITPKLINVDNDGKGISIKSADDLDQRTFYEYEYVFIPPKFITISNLDSAFNFVILLPSNKDVKYGNKESDVHTYYLMYNTSLRQKTETGQISIQYGLPSKAIIVNATPNSGSYIFSGAIYTANYGTNVASNDLYYRYFLVYQPTTTDPSKPMQGYNAGLDDYYNISYNRLLSSNLLWLLNGRILGESTTLNSLYATNNTYVVYDSAVGNAAYSINRYLIFPQSSKSITPGNTIFNSYPKRVNMSTVNSSADDVNPWAINHPGIAWYAKNSIGVEEKYDTTTGGKLG